MHIRYFSIQRAYEIKCKIFLPEDQNVKSLIVGVHGFAGDKISFLQALVAILRCYVLIDWKIFHLC